MPISKTLVLVSALTLTLQFLIFAYLYSSHRVRFFRYLLLAWGLLTRATFRRDWNTVRTPSGSQGPRSTPRPPERARGRGPGEISWETRRRRDILHVRSGCLVRLLADPGSG
jgi:hypothetical protein